MCHLLASDVLLWIFDQMWTPVDDVVLQLMWRWCVFCCSIHRIISSTRCRNFVVRSRRNKRSVPKSLHSQTVAGEFVFTWGSIAFPIDFFGSILNRSMNEITDWYSGSMPIGSTCKEHCWYEDLMTTSCFLKCCYNASKTPCEGSCWSDSGIVLSGIAVNELCVSLS